jgi:hypothetical protein
MAAKGKKQRITVDGTVLKVEYPTIRKTVTVDVSRFSEEVRHEAMLHGFKQKYGDVESGGTAAEKYDMLQRVIAAHESGNWDVTVGTRDDSGIIIEAVARRFDYTVEQVQKALEAAEDREAKLKEWRSNAKVKATIAEIRAERAAKAAEEAEDDDIDLDVEE